jgi:hypothetical protein
MRSRQVLVASAFEEWAADWPRDAYFEISALQHDVLRMAYRRSGNLLFTLAEREELETLFQDLRDSERVLTKTPVFAIVAVLITLPSAGECFSNSGSELMLGAFQQAEVTEDRRTTPSLSS